MNRRSFIVGSAQLGLAVATLPAARSALAGGPGRLGRFQGTSNHATTGTAEIASDRVNLLDDFSFDGAPDPKVALGRDGYDPATLMGPLRSNGGASSYSIPAGIDADRYNEVWIWCEQYDVPLGIAKIGG